MELLQAMKERRSIRKYTEQPVDRALLDKLLKESLWAPSGMNRQPWKYIVMDGAAMDKLCEFSAGVGETMEEPLIKQNFNEKMRKLVRGYFKNLGGAKTAVICLSKSMDTYLADHANMVSCASCFYNFLLLAHEAGLSTCWMTGYANQEEAFMKFLGIEGYKLVGVTPIGYGDQTVPVPPRKHEDIEWHS